MKSIKISAIALGLAAASALAQTAPAEAPAAEPATQATAEVQQPVADSAAVAAEEAKKAEEAKAAEEAKKAEEAKAADEAKKAEEAKAAEEAKKAEEAKAAEEAKKAEEAKVAEEAKKTEASFTERLTINKADEAPESKKARDFKISGAVEFDAYGYWKNDEEKALYHDYWSTFDLNIEVNFNEKWSAHAQIEADGPSEWPYVHYNEAYIQYQKNDNFFIKFGDLTYAEGGFNYYDYIDPADYGAGMKEHDIRGLELDLYGLQLGLGFGRGTNDYYVGECRIKHSTDKEDTVICETSTGKSYDAHAAYQLDIVGQVLRPYVHYKSWQEGKANELHAGLDAALAFGPFGIHAVYGLHVDRLNANQPDATHAFLVEPTFKVANVNIKGGFFYAYFADGWPTFHSKEIPEYMFAYGEGDIKLTDAVTIGLLGELHTNSIEDDTDLNTLNFGTRIYFSPVDGLDVTGFAMAILPVGKDWEKSNHADFVFTKDYGDDVNLYLGVETVFSF